MDGLTPETIDKITSTLSRAGQQAWTISVAGIRAEAIATLVLALPGFLICAGILAWIWLRRVPAQSRAHAAKYADRDGWTPSDDSWFDGAMVSIFVGAALTACAVMLRASLINLMVPEWGVIKMILAAAPR